jgi:hypothetical protein
MNNLGVMTGIMVSLLGLDPLRVPAPIVLLGFILDVGIATAVVLVIWTGLKLFVAQIADMLEIQSTKQRLVIARGLTRHDYETVRKAVRGWYLLVVRYGTDDYLRNMAGPGDREVGRPRYATVAMALSLSATGEVVLQWSLPVHRRLGTQFRCYIETRPDSTAPAVLTGMLKHYDEIDVLESAVENPRRMYFLLKRFPIVATPDGIRQNFVLPE